jgi:hypothetical protein
VIGPPLASVIIFAILAFSVTAIAITSLVIGYLEKRNSLSQRGRSEELHYKYQGGGGPGGAQSGASPRGGSHGR